MLEYTADANLCYLRELAGCFLKRRHVREFAHRDAGHLTAFPETKRSKIIRRDRITSQTEKLVKHFRVVAGRETHFVLANPQKSLRISDEARRANAGNRKKMKESGFA